MTPASSFLQALTRNELLEFADLLAVEVADRRVKAPLVEALSDLDSEDLAEMLSTLSRARLKELCRGLELDDSGKAKTTIVERLVAHNMPRSPSRAEPAPKPAAPATSKPATRSRTRIRHFWSGSGCCSRHVRLWRMLSSSTARSARVRECRLNDLKCVDRVEWSC
jgi:hypothetical protein